MASNGIVRSRVIKIGNSQGVRIPKLLLEQANLCEEVELEVGPERIIIRPAQRARQGWDEAFRAMAAAQVDELLDAETTASTVWDEEEWEW